jgi:hypothetical protein
MEEHVRRETSKDILRAIVFLFETYSIVVKSKMKAVLITKLTCNIIESTSTQFSGLGGK